MSDRYKLDDAASAALWMLSLEKDKTREHMGLLYRDGDDYKKTDTVSGGDSSVKGKLTVPAGSLAGLFHNHPGITVGRGDRATVPVNDSQRQKFSPDDRNRAQTLGIPSYISIDNRVRRYDPKNGTTEDVLAQFPIEEVKKHIAARIRDSNMAPDIKLRLLGNLFSTTQAK